MQALFSLANNPDRLMRLVNHLLDKGFAVTSHCVASALGQSAEGVFMIHFDESSEIALIDELPCQHMQINLVANNPDLELIRLILEAGGAICEEPAEADLIVGDSGDINDLRRQHPRKLVIDDAELASLLNDVLQADRLLAPVDPNLTPVPRLPENLKACWAKLRRRSIPTINEGLDLLEALLQTDPTAGDPLLDQVEVVDGELFPGRRFRLGDSFTHPYSYYALLGILSRSPAGSRAEALRLGIKSLDHIEAIALPELKSFENVEKIRIHILEPDKTRHSFRLSASWSGLLSLTELSLSMADGATIQFDYLDAPKLKDLTLVGAEFKEIDGASQCTHLSTIDISHTSITDLTPLSAICKSLKYINLSGTGITTLEPLSGCQQIEGLNIDICKQLPSLRGLETARITEDHLRIRKAAIDSLQYFPCFEGACLELGDLPLSNLKGIDKLKSLVSIQGSGQHAANIVSAEPLTAS
ncbi:hypothetical protein [Synechococcus sp. CBW1006]|uniref:hypothetical protein n=1 Tax=Synechococcus sp. CBW1006 TaxID=1353138 RepID=UPI0018CF1517|nr:hypothetical protein [Synechococcus sp. CBW1006]QPN66551.1 hypothetical protein H8F26_17810 [Synechococcus sp. CBW1006]